MNFALLACPHSPGQIQDLRPLCKWLPENWLPSLTRYMDVSHYGDVKVGGLNGLLFNFPLLPGQDRHAKLKATQAAEKIKTAGVRVVGLETGLRNLTPVFNDLGLATAGGYALEVAGAAAIMLKHTKSFQDLRAVIVNPINSSGSAWARILAPKVRNLTLMGNFRLPMERLAKRILLDSGTAPVITKMDYETLTKADLIIDLASTDLNILHLKSNQIIWQHAPTNYSGQATVINQVLVDINTNLQLEGDLPNGLLRASTAEAILCSLGEERLWPRSLSEVTTEQISRVSRIADRIELPIIGYISHSKIIRLTPQTWSFDK